MLECHQAFLVGSKRREWSTCGSLVLDSLGITEQRSKLGDRHDSTNVFATWNGDRVFQWQLSSI